MPTGDEAALIALLEAPARVLAEYASDAAYIAEPDGTLRWLSPALPRVLGWQPEDLIGTTLRSLVHPDDTPAALAWRETLLNATDSAAGVETDPLRFRRADGTWVWCSVSAVRATDADGRFIGITGSIHGVDSLVRARERAAEAHDRLHAVLDALIEPQVTLVALRDGGGEVVDFVYEDANAPAAEFHHLGVADVVGATVRQVLGDDIGEPDVRAAAEVLASGEATVWNDVLSQVRERQGLGPTWLDIRIVPVDADRVSYSWRDVTERRRSADEVTRAHNLLRAVIDAQVDPHVIVSAVRDADGRIVDFRYEDANRAAAAFEGIERDLIVGRTLTEVYPSLDEALEDIDFCRTALETGQPVVRNDSPTLGYVDAVGRAVITDIRVVAVDDERVSYTWRDVTDRHLAQARLAESEQRFRLLAENMTDLVVLVRDGAITWVSPSITAALGWEPDELVGIDPFALIHPDDLLEVTRSWEGPVDGILSRVRYRLRRKDDGYHWVDGEGSAVPTAGEDSVTLVLAARIVDAEVAALAALEDQAQHDELTGLMNRHAVFDRLRRMVLGDVRAGTRVGMVFCDLDGFKAVNDRFGHTAGDTLLRAIAGRMEAAVRSGDIVARIGGDELLVVLSGVRDLDDALRIAGKLREAIAEETEVPGGRVSVSASLGVTLADHGESIDAIVARADTAMYEAKRRGKDSVVAVPSFS